MLWGHKDGTRINPLTDGMRMFQEMLRIRYYDLVGNYDGRPAAVLHPVTPGEPVSRA